jgi:predicted Holliday junction resolvase-like endonuclease
LANPLQDPIQQQALVEKVQKPIADSLEKEYDRLNEKMFESWKDKESKRIETLQTSLDDVKNSQEKVMGKTTKNIP